MKLASTIGAYVLAGLLFIQAFQAPIVYMAFKIQQDYIAANLCENRYEPITVCRGSCVLKEDLQVVFDQEAGKSTTPQRLKVETSVYCIHDFLTLQDLEFRITHDEGNTTYADKLVSSFISDFFVPPRV